MRSPPVSRQPAWWPNRPEWAGPPGCCTPGGSQPHARPRLHRSEGTTSLLESVSYIASRRPSPRYRPLDRRFVRGCIPNCPHIPATRLPALRTLRGPGRDWQTALGGEPSGEPRIQQDARRVRPARPWSPYVSGPFFVTLGGCSTTVVQLSPSVLCGLVHMLEGERAAKPEERWRARRDSNSGPSAPEADALSN
jgi:hypothetical protein